MFKKLLNIDITVITFIMVMLFGVAFYFEAFDGLLFSDDFSYANYAYKITLGTFEFTDDIFNHRFGVFLPVALLYKIFGVNDITTTIWPFICYTCIIIALFFYLNKKDKMACTVAIILSSLSFYPIYFSNKLFPDVIISLFALLTVMIVVEREHSNKILYALLFSLTFFYGFLVKETILYLLPFIGVIFINDVIKKKAFKFWVYSLVFLSAMAIIYFWFYYIKTGDIFYRFQVIHDGHYASGGSYFDKSTGALIARITYEPLLMLISTELIIPVLIGIPLLFNFKKLSRAEKEWTLAALMLLGTFWIGTTSLKFYNPIALNGRMFIMIVPLWAVVAGISLSKLKINVFYFIGFLAAATIAAFLFFNNKQTLIYLLVGLFFLLLCLKAQWKGSYMLVLILVLLVHPLYTIYKTSDKEFETLKILFSDKLSALNEKTTLVTDPLTKHSYLYFFKFKDQENLNVISFKDLTTNKDLVRGQAFCLLDRRNLDELRSINFSIPAWFTDTTGKNVIFNSNGVIFYKSSKENIRESISRRDK